MSGDPCWAYAQARLQSRHGDRLAEADWHALEAVRSANAFIDRSHRTSLRRFTEQVSADMNSHAIERTLRGAWRAYVNEVARWLPTAWRPAVSWAGHLPDLPTIRALLEGEAPAWIQLDPVLAVFAKTDPAQRCAALQDSPFGPLLPTDENNENVPVGPHWARHWRALWPKNNATDQRALNALAHAVQTHVERLACAGARETSATHHRDLERTATRLFRRHAASPTAVFSHFVLTALDLERLRGGIVRRRLFEPAQRRQAA